MLNLIPSLCSRAVFNAIHKNCLIYNSCWEDPRLDRRALELEGRTVVTITSAGCNALDYLLGGAKAVHAVDMNPRQNALLELKVSAIRNLDWIQFFSMFGTGSLNEAETIYWGRLRSDISPQAARYWDKNIGVFSGRSGRSFYFYGTSGLVARVVNRYIDSIPGLRRRVNLLLNSQSPDDQHSLYWNGIKQRFFGRFIRFITDRDLLLALLGVPPAQRKQLEGQTSNGVSRFIENCLDSVFGRLPIQDNYFWQLYLRGRYPTWCCPEYLKEENFLRLRELVSDRLTTHTSSLLDFLRSGDEPIDGFALLDHMDWLSNHRRNELSTEWQLILERSRPGTRIIWRSAARKVDYVDSIPVQLHGRTSMVGELLEYKSDLARELHQEDRVHTYASFYVAEVAQ